MGKTANESYDIICNTIRNKLQRGVVYETDNRRILSQ